MWPPRGRRPDDVIHARYARARGTYSDHILRLRKVHDGRSKLVRQDFFHLRFWSSSKALHLKEGSGHAGTYSQRSPERRQV